MIDVHITFKMEEPKTKEGWDGFSQDIKALISRLKTTDGEIQVFILKHTQW